MPFSFIKSSGCRNFSVSNIFRNVEKSKLSEPTFSGSTKDFVPTDYDKKILIWSGKYKSNNIPPRISFTTLDNAKSRLRIKIANFMVIGTILMCGYYVWVGKESQSKGESFMQMEKERQKMYEMTKNK